MTQRHKLRFFKIITSKAYPICFSISRDGELGMLYVHLDMFRVTSNVRGLCAVSPKFDSYNVNPDKVGPQPQWKRACPQHALNQEDTIFVAKLVNRALVSASQLA